MHRIRQSVIPFCVDIVHCIVAGTVFRSGVRKTAMVKSLVNYVR
jgi:hypothetical protein